MRNINIINNNKLLFSFFLFTILFGYAGVSLVYLSVRYMLSTVRSKTGNRRALLRTVLHRRQSYVAQTAALILPQLKEWNQFIGTCIYRGFELLPEWC